MDKRNERILNYLLSVSEEGRYVVIRVADILQQVKLTDSQTTRDQVVEAVKSFVDNEYIGCKYYDNENICCVSMPRGRNWRAQATQNKKTDKKKFWVMATVVIAVIFIAAFVGGLVGGIVAAML